MDEHLPTAELEVGGTEMVGVVLVPRICISVVYLSATKSFTYTFVCPSVLT